MEKKESNIKAEAIIKDFFSEPSEEDFKKNNDSEEDLKEDLKKDVSEDDPFPLKEKKKKEDDKNNKDNKEENISILRKQRDDERNKNKIYTETLGEHKPESLKPIVEFLSETIEGPITHESVSEFLETVKVQAARIEELENNINEKEKTVQQLDIRESQEFKLNFQKPYEEAFETLYLEYANIGSDNNVIAPVATDAFKSFIIENPETTAIQLKSEMAKFVKSYKEESGEDPVIPSVSSLMNSLRTFKDKREKLKDAYENWKEKKEEIHRNNQKKNEEDSANQQKLNKKQRVDLARKAYNEFNSEEISFVEDTEVQSLFREEHQFTEKIISGEDVPEYDKLFQRGVKARLWDKYSSQLSELIKFKKDFEENERSGLTGSDKAKPLSSGEKDHWLTSK